MGNETESAGDVFGRRVREERLRLGWRLSDLAARAAEHGLDRHLTYFAKVERGQMEPRLGEAVMTAATLGLPLTALLVPDAGQIADRAAELTRQALEAAETSSRSMELAAQLLNEAQALSRSTYQPGKE